jgi:hypothetical protein
LPWRADPSSRSRGRCPRLRCGLRTSRAQRAQERALPVGLAGEEFAEPQCAERVPIHAGRGPLRISANTVRQGRGCRGVGGGGSSGASAGVGSASHLRTRFRRALKKASFQRDTQARRGRESERTRTVHHDRTGGRSSSRYGRNQWGNFTFTINLTRGSTPPREATQRGRTLQGREPAPTLAREGYGVRRAARRRMVNTR